ncbi:Eugenol synthase 1, partial [Globisporangium splendens]
MVAYKSFAVIGVGSLGSLVVNELLKNKVSVKVLTRDDTKPVFATFKGNGATIVKVDYSSESELTKVLSDVEVVVSAISHLALAEQPAFAKVAKAAGVQLFVPAEYGFDFTESFTYKKKVVQDALKALDLPYTLFLTGFFDSFYPALGFDYANGRIRAVGSGDRPFSVTARADIARFVAHVLTTAEPSNLAWTTIPIEGDRKSHHEIAAIAEKKLGKKFEIEYVDVEEIRKNIEANPIALFTTKIADGKAVTGSEEEVKTTINKFYPDWNPSTIDELITL